MDMKLKTTFFILGTLSSLILPCGSEVRAQHENDNWRVAEGLISFKSGSPIALTDTCNGNTLAAEMWSDRHTGTPLIRAIANLFFLQNCRELSILPRFGDTAYAIGPLVIPKPLSESEFYSFRDYGPLFYPWDRNLPSFGPYAANLDTGLIARGGISSQVGVQLPGPAGIGSIAIRHRNMRDYWVISHTNLDNRFLVRQVTPSGISLAGNEYAVTIPDYTPGELSGGHRIQFCASHDGSMIASIVCIYPSLARYFQVDEAANSIQLFHFDRLTGRISDRIYLCDSPYWGNFTRTVPAGACFSPNDSILYVSMNSESEQNAPFLLQFDLRRYDSASIMSSSQRFPRGFWTTEPGVLNLWGGNMLAAPDGKIYIENYESFTVSALRYPNILGKGCDLQDTALLLHANYYGLEFMQNICETDMFDTSRGYNHTIEFDGVPTSVCGNECWQFTSWPEANAVGWQWTFAGARTQTSSGKSVGPICYDTAGTYPVKLVTDYGDHKDTLIKYFKVGIPAGVLPSFTDTLAAAKAGSDFVLPISIKTPPSFAFDSNIVIYAGIDLTYDYRVVDVPPGEIASRVELNPGWDIVDSTRRSPTSLHLLLAYTPKNTSDSVVSPIKPGYLHFKAVGATGSKSQILLNYVQLWSTERVFDFCTVPENNALATVTIGTSGVEEASAALPSRLDVSLSGSRLELSVSGEPFRYQIVDAVGRIVLDGETASDAAILNASALPSGFYLAIARTSHGALTRRFEIGR